MVIMSTSRIRKTGGSIGPLPHFIGRGFARLLGWKVQGPFPDVDKAIFIASPHTSNWDGFYMLMCAWVLRVRLSWITKDSMFKPGIGWFIRWMGGVPVDRSKNNDTVKQIAEQFAAADQLYLAIAPDGTRSLRDRWRSGFYYMAVEAQVPLVLGFLDYKRKIGGCGPCFMPTGDVSADMDRIRDFYADIGGKFPELTSPARLSVEDELEAARAVGREAS